MRLGHPRLHLRVTDSTNERARELAARGAPHGTLVTADQQTAGRGRQGRNWSAPPGRALLCSLVLHDLPSLTTLAAGTAVAELTGPAAQLKWPNDVLLDGRKVAGILVEGRLQEHWAVLGIGINVAVRAEDLPAEIRARAGTLGLEPQEIEPLLERLLQSLEQWLSATPQTVLNEVRRRDALRERRVRWSAGEGRGAGIDDEGRLIVRSDGEELRLDAGEVHLVEQ